jgi:diguanylate cyclase (GGDEF)-like protein
MVSFNTIRQGLCLNRDLSLSLLGVSVPLSYLGQFAHKTPGPWPWLSFAMFGIISLGFWVLSEACLRFLKRMPRFEDSNLRQYSRLIPFCSLLYLVVGYALTGHLALLLCLPFPALQAQVCGYRAFGRLLLLCAAVVYIALCPFGYPRSLEEFYGAGILSMNGLQLFLSIVPMAWLTYQVGDFVAGWVKSTSFRVNKLQSLASTDALTGLINRGQFNVRLESERARAKRYRHNLCLALFDIDDFKKINDVYGHPVGDRILTELGQLISNNVRETDIPARYGGEEFALILPETSMVHATDLLERLRFLVEETVFCLPDNPLPITLSVGVQELHYPNMPIYELIAQADAALYQAKRNGKNQVVCASSSTQSAAYPVRS